MEKFKLFKILNNKNPGRWQIVAAKDTVEAFKFCTSSEKCISSTDSAIVYQEANCKVEELKIPGYKITVTKEG